MYILCTCMHVHIVYMISQGEVSALIWAAYKGHSDVVAQLLEAGANPDLLSKVCMYM